MAESIANCLESIATTMIMNNVHSLTELSKHDPIDTGIDPNRPPQLNPDNMSCHCVCDCIRGTPENDGVLPDAPTVDFDNDDIASITTSDYDEQNIAGDEGIEDHLIEVGDSGYIPIKTIHLALARHDRCTCHHGIGALTSADDYPFTALPSRAESPGLPLGGSMMVEVGSEEQSLASSLLSLQSRNSSVFALAGGWASHDSLAPAIGVYIFNPLILTPEPGYPLELSISDGDVSQHEVW